MTPEEILNKAIEHGNLVKWFGQDVVEQAKKNALSRWDWNDENLTVELAAEMLRENCIDIIEEEKKRKEEEEENRLFDIQYDLAERIKRKVGGKIYSSESSVYLETITHKIRISNHMARPTYQNLYGEADIEVAVGRNHPDADYFLPSNSTSEDIEILANIIAFLVDNGEE